MWDGSEIASGSCYAHNGNAVGTCTASTHPSNANRYGTTFYVTIDSNHGTWNWMGDFDAVCADDADGKY
jgi:hypothetical protein